MALVSAMQPAGVARQGQLRPGAILLIAKREAGSRLLSFWLFFVATAICLFSFLYGSAFQASFETETVLVTSDPLAALNAIVVPFIGFALGLRLATSIAWEREHHTLEVLLAGPTNWVQIVLAKFIVEVAVLYLLTLFYILYLLAGQPLGWGVVSLADMGALGVLPLFVLPVLALGLLASAFAQTVRGAVLAYLLAVGVLSLFETSLAVLSAMPPEQMTLASLYLRSVLQSLAPVVQHVSAVSGLAETIMALFGQNTVSSGQFVGVIVLTIAILGGAIATGIFRGAR